MPNKAVCIGINYKGTEFELNGCLNDAKDWSAFFTKGGFGVAQLLEANATRAAIISSADNLVTSLKPGEVGALTYSGHGTWLPDRSGDEPDGRDEALVPYDCGDDGRNLVIDDELGKIFGKLKAGAVLVLLTDSCHSGTAFRFFGNGASKRRVRFLPPSHFLKDTDLYHKMERAFGQPPKRANSPLPGVIHFSGCRDNEYSADADIGGKFSGAFTHYALMAFKQVLARKGSYYEVFKQIRQYLPSWDFQQTPLFNATTDLRSRPLF